MTNHESGNRVIAEFMEQDNICGILETGSNPLRAFFSYKEIKAFAKNGYSVQLQYHTSWEWIMPVVEKIYLMREVTDFVIRMGEVEISIIGRGSIKSPCIISNNSITELWIAIVEFIEWHNTRLNNHTSSKSDL